MVAIGVDPAFRKNGFWACIIETTERSAAFRPFRDLLEWDRFIHGPDAPESCFVCVENSNKQNRNFDMSGSRPELARKGRNVGTNQAVSELAVRSAVDRYGEDAVLNVSPREKGAKWDERTFFNVVRSDGITLFGYTGNQDQRDAYKLAWMAMSEAKKPVPLRIGAKHNSKRS